MAEHPITAFITVCKVFCLTFLYPVCTFDMLHDIDRAQQFKSTTLLNVSAACIVVLSSKCLINECPHEHYWVSRLACDSMQVSSVLTLSSFDCSLATSTILLSPVQVLTTNLQTNGIIAGLNINWPNSLRSIQNAFNVVQSSMVNTVSMDCSLQYWDSEIMSQAQIEAVIAMLVPIGMLGIFCLMWICRFVALLISSPSGCVAKVPHELSPT